MAGSAYGFVYLFQGDRLDPASGFYNSRNRDYSATLGRWLQQDPLRYGAGSMNLYQMEGDQPVGAADPSGANPLLFGAAGAAIGFVVGGLSGKCGWSSDRAWAGALSGFMFGLGFGLLGTSAAWSVIGALMGAGLGSAIGGGLFGNGAVDWTGYFRGAVTGGVMGYTGGLVAASLPFGAGVVGGLANAFI